MIRVGKIAATRGLTGAIVITHLLEGSGWLTPGLPLMVEIRKDSRIPYFVQRVLSSMPGEAVVMLEDVAAIEAAKPIVGKPIWVEDAVVQSAADATSPLRWIGYKLVDKTRGAVGPIADVVQAGPQWLAQVDAEGREVLVPLVEAFILEVNSRNRYLRMDLPEGLLDL